MAFKSKGDNIIDLFSNHLKYTRQQMWLSREQSREKKFYQKANSYQGFMTALCQILTDFFHCNSRKKINSGQFRVSHWTLCFRQWSKFSQVSYMTTLHLPISGTFPSFVIVWEIWAEKKQSSQAATVGKQKADQIQKVSGHLKRETIFPFKVLIVLVLVKTRKHFSYSSLTLKINLKCSSKA